MRARKGRKLRVIAGVARRTALAAPKGLVTRPTADRIKENLFNIIAPYVPGARFLDLFCGSGAVGIEAISRGASEAVFVDESKEAVSVTEANLNRVKFANQANVLCMCALDAISLLKRQGKSFDIIYLDPPYGDSFLAKALNALTASQLLSQEGIVIVECSLKEPQNSTESLKLYDTRVYGSTRLEFYLMQT